MKKSFIILLSAMLPCIASDAQRIADSYCKMVSDREKPDKTCCSCLENLRRLLCKPAGDGEQSPQASPRDPKKESLLGGASVLITDAEAKTSSCCLIL